MPSTLMLLSNPYRPDPRVLLEARALKGAGFDIHLVAWDREESKSPESVEGGIHVVRLGPKAPQRAPAKILARLPRFWFKALRATRTLKFDIVHANDFDTLPLGMMISRLSGKPLLYDAHELYAKMIENEVGPISKLVWIWERRCARKADAVVTVSSALAEMLSVGRNDRARVVTTSQDPSVAEGTDIEAVRGKYGLKGFVVAYLGSLEPGRFVEETVTSFTEADNITVVVAGNGTLKTMVSREALHNPTVKFIGTVDSDEALRITRASDIVVAMMDPSNPNNIVGTPGKIINALAVGRPVITTKGLIIAERIRESGSGIVIPYAKNEFIEAVLKSKADARGLAEMGSKGRALFDSDFSWKTSAEQLLDAYRALMVET